MLSCVASSKQLDGPPEDDDGAVTGAGTPRSRLAMKALTTQIRGMAIRASGAYRQCKPCSGVWERRECTELEASESGNGTPASMSGRTEEAESVTVEEDEKEEREWIAQVEPGVLITFVSVSGGGNDLKRIRFSKEMFYKEQAQKWWAENHDKVMELYNVRSSNHPPPTLPGSEEESLIKKEMVRPMTPPVSREKPHINSNRTVMASSSDNSQEHHHHHHHHHQQGYSSGGLTGTPKLSSNSGANKGIVGTSSSSSSSSSSLSLSSIKEQEEEVVVDGCGGGGETSVSSNGSSSVDQEREWVEQDEPGVYLTIRARPGGVRELRRVRFSRERFGEMLARMWWEENRDRIHKQYLFNT